MFCHIFKSDRQITDYMSRPFYKAITEEMYTDEPDLSHRDQLTYHHHIYQHETTTSLSLTSAASILLRYTVLPEYYRH